jgi:thiol-disulfide isomerase/thioredoxin
MIDLQHKRRLITVAAIVLVQTAAVLVYMKVERARHAPVEAPFRYERSAPLVIPGALELVSSDGARQRWSDLHDRPLLLHFWATWCAPCRTELPSLLQLARDQPRLRVVALSLDVDWPVVRTFFGTTVPGEVMREPARMLAKACNVSALPITYLFTRKGDAALRFAGAREWRSAAARTLLAPYIAEL